FWMHQFRKAVAFCKNKEYPQNVSFYVFRGLSSVIPLLPVGFGLVFSLFVASLVYYLPRFRDLWFVYSFIILYSLSIIAFFIIGRFRITVIPIMVVTAGAFANEIFVRIKNKTMSNLDKKEKIRILISVMIFILMFIFSEPWKEADLPMHWDNTAKASFARGDMPRYRRCIEKLIILEGNDDAKLKELLLENFATTVVLNEWNEAEEIFSEIRLRYPKESYLDRTYEEFLKYRIYAEKNQITMFSDYALKTENPGHLSEFIRKYIAVQEYIRRLQTEK
ncbi:MAG TPA: hypothetical protein PK821_08190, partial [Victivallales bacterium]|nr:hypothetical protein [Victivallales bacterium]